MEQMDVSERRACMVLEQPRSAQRRIDRPDEAIERLIERMVELACQYGKYGYRRITILVRREGWHVNHKRVERLWRQEGLKVPQKQPKRRRLRFNDGSCVRLRPEHRNHVWSYDFVSERTSDGRPIRILNIIDEYTRECLAIRVRRTIKANDVIDTLSDLFITRGIPLIRSTEQKITSLNTLNRATNKMGQVETSKVKRGSVKNSMYFEGKCCSFRSDSSFSRKYDIFILTGGDVEAGLQGYMGYSYLLEQVKEYESPKAKITTMIKSGAIIRVRRGLYVPGQANSYSLKTLANRIYGPSYISFEYALAYHNLIPERVTTITSASLAKNKRKGFRTPVVTFVYHSVVPAVFPYGVMRREENGHPFPIATKEKALCDALSKLKGHYTHSSVEDLLYEDLRMEQEDIFAMNLPDIEFLVPLYRKKLLSDLLAYLKLNATPKRRVRA